MLVSTERRLAVRDLDTDRQTAHPGRSLQGCRGDGCTYGLWERRHARREAFLAEFQGSVGVSSTWLASYLVCGEYNFPSLVAKIGGFGISPPIPMCPRAIIGQRLFLGQ